MTLSIVIPIYNRPDELRELLDSLTRQTYDHAWEIIIVEDGSDNMSKTIVNQYDSLFNIKYLLKNNSGPGLSRNAGMKMAEGDLILLLDSDVILPENYLTSVAAAFEQKAFDAFGGRDMAHPSFNGTQKAINYAMTSFLTTGGLRGSEKNQSNFQLRSFNAGLTPKAFKLTGGFSQQRIGEDIDLNFRLRSKGLKVSYLHDVAVFHKRRTTWSEFFKQVFRFGAGRPVLNRMHPGTSKLTYWFPTMFLFGLVLSVVTALFGWYLPLMLFGMYSILLIIHASWLNRSFGVGILSFWAMLIQFTGYGLGFVRSWIRLHLLSYPNKKAFPYMFR